MAESIYRDDLAALDGALVSLRMFRRQYAAKSLGCGAVAEEIAAIERAIARLKTGRAAIDDVDAMVDNPAEPTPELVALLGSDKRIAELEAEQPPTREGSER